MKYGNIAWTTLYQYVWWCCGLLRARARLSRDSIWNWAKKVHMWEWREYFWWCVPFVLTAAANYRDMPTTAYQNSNTRQGGRTRDPPPFSDLAPTTTKQIDFYTTKTKVLLLSRSLRAFRFWHQTQKLVNISEKSVVVLVRWFRFRFIVEALSCPPWQLQTHSTVTLHTIFYDAPQWRNLYTRPKARVGGVHLWGQFLLQLLGPRARVTSPFLCRLKLPWFLFIWRYKSAMNR